MMAAGGFSGWRSWFWDPCAPDTDWLRGRMGNRKSTVDKSGNEAERDNMFTIVFFCDHMTHLTRVSGMRRNLKLLYCRDNAVVVFTLFSLYSIFEANRKAESESCSAGEEKA